MSGSRTFEIKITGDTSGVQGALGRASRAAEDASRKVGGIGAAARAAEGAVGGMAARLGGLGAGLSAMGPAGLAAAAAMGALSAAIVPAIRSAEQFERIGMRTEAIVRATGSAAGLTAQQIRGMAQTIARETLASTEGVEQAAQKLLTFRSVAGDAFERTLRAAQDLAATGFGSLESATVQLGKALENPLQGISALAESGVSFTQSQRGVIAALVETGRQAEAQRLILEAVEKQVGGAGRAEAGGLSGAYDTLKQNIQEVFAQLGSLGPIQAATGAVNVLADAVGRVNRALQGLAESRAPEAVAERAVEAAQRRLEQIRQTNEAQSSAGAYGPSRQELEGQAAALRIAEENLAAAQQRLREIRERGEADAARVAAEGAATRAGIEREAAQAGLDALRAARDQRLAIERTYQRAVATINRAVAAGVLDAAGAQRELAEADDVRRQSLAALSQQAAAAAAREVSQRERVRAAVERDEGAARRELATLGDGVAAREALAVELEVENRLREAGIPAVEARTAAERESADAIERSVRAHAALRAEITQRDNAAQEARREAERALQEVARTAERISDDVAGALFDGMTGQGRQQSVLDTFKNLFRRIAIEALSANIILPITTAIVGGEPRLFGISGAGAGGAAGGLGDVFGIGSAFNSLTGGGLTNTLGLSGLFGGGGLGGLLNTTIIPATGPIGPTLSGAAMGGGASLGQLLGGVGLGFGAGSMLGGMLAGNNPIRARNAQFGAGGGAAIGAAIGSIIPGIGTVIGGLIGGLLGGAGGGLIGPKPSNKEGNATIDLLTGAVSIGGQTGGKFSQANRDAAAATAQQIQALLGTIATAADGQLGGGRFTVGVGDRDGVFARIDGQEIGRWGRDERGMERLLDAVVTRLLPSITGGQSDQLRAALTASGADTAREIGEVAAFFGDIYRPLTEVKEPLDAFEEALKALNKTYDDAVKRARELGLAEAALEDGRARAIADLRQQRTDAAAGVLAGPVSSLADFVRSLRVANDNPLSPLGRLDAARSEFDRTIAAALDGDLGALGRVQNSAQSLLAVSRDVNGSGVGFAQDFQATLSRLESLSAFSLDALTSAVFAAETRSQTEILTAELQRLRAELAGLRAEVQQGNRIPDRLAA
jgi:hypothetical protein